MIRISSFVCMLNNYECLFVSFVLRDNSKKEWEFRKAVTILTYCSYHPIPVPLNIISILVIAIYGLIRKKMHQKDDKGDAGGNSRLVKCW